MKTSEGLAKAAQVMADRGHNKGSYIAKNGSVCAMGAIFIASGAEIVPVTVSDEVIGYSIRTDVDGYNSNLSYHCVEILRSFLSENWNRFGWRISSIYEGVPEWNDRKDYETVHTALVEASEWFKQFEN